MDYEPIIGLEIHLQLKTKTKMFCSCLNEDEASPNKNICEICYGSPGVLPTINKKAVEFAILIGLALNGEINPKAKFDRKNYFYPDLPKGYQISQYDLPLIKNGYLEIETKEGKRKIRIRRIHLEEDTAKLIHTPDKKYSLIDFNRAGIPLLEIVTEPDFRSPEEAKIFLQELRLIARYQNVSSADMEKGHLRCDANISLKKGNRITPKVEIKNMNSFKAVERALTYEIQRQKKLWDEGVPIQVQETRGWDEIRQRTVEQRVKEEAEDYRYFPEPDLPPMVISSEWIGQIRKKIRELPQMKRKRFVEEYGFSLEEAKILTSDRNLSYYVEKVISELREWISSLEEVEGEREEIWEKNKKKLVKLVANWIINRLLKLFEEYKIVIPTRALEWNKENLKVTPENFAEFISLIYQNKISSKIAQEILKKMVETGIDPSQLIEEEKMEQISEEEELIEIVKKVIEENEKAKQDYLKGKENALQFLIGQVMKETKGRANPKIVEKMLKKFLKCESLET